MEEKNWNDYTYSDDEKVMVCQIRNTLQELSDKVNCCTIKREDLVTILGATTKRIDLLNKKIEGHGN